MSLVKLRVEVESDLVIVYPASLVFIDNSGKIKIQ